MLCVFDVNETLLDVSPLDDVFGSVDKRQEWFRLVIHTALTITATGDYRDFAEIAGAVARQQGVDLGTKLRTLPPHGDVLEGLGMLRAQGHTLVALTNSPLSTAEVQVRDLGMDRVFSAEQVRRLKPAPEAYQQVLAAYPGADAVMIAAHDWDIAGAQAAGLKTALLTRPGVHPLPGAPAPTYTASTLTELAELLKP